MPRPPWPSDERSARSSPVRWSPAVSTPLGWVGGGLLVVAGALLVAVELVVPPIRAEA